MDDRQLMEEDALETEEEQHEKMPEIFRGTQMTRDAKAERERSQRFSDDSELLRGTTELEDAAEDHQKLEDDMVSLIMSKKAGFGKKGEDSDDMQTLKGSLMELVFQFSKKVPEDDKEYANGVSNVMEMYKTAIANADTYIGRIESQGKGKYLLGKRRLKLARRIQKQLSVERRLFTASARALRDNPEPGRKYEWRDVLKDVRGQKLDLSGKKVSVVGAGVSRIYKIEDDAGKTTFIKPEERRVEAEDDYLGMVAMFRNISPDAADFLNMIENAGKKGLEEGEDSEGTDKNGEKLFLLGFFTDIKSTYSYTLKENGKSKSELDAEAWILKHNAVRKNATKSKVGTAIWNVVDGNLKYEKLLVELGNFLDKKSVEAQSANTSKIEAGSSMSDRNVSSYRLAKRLGQEDIMAKSETIVMKDTFGRDVRANSMEGADGIEFNDAINMAKAANKVLTFRPESLMQYFSLRILDLIAGQTDRHAGNFMVKISEDDDTVYVDSIKGIDNDAAFGLLTPEDIESGKASKLDSLRASYSGGYGGPVIQSVKYIPKSLYDNIVNYSDEEIEYDNVDLRTRKEIDALKARLSYVRNEIEALVSEKKLMLVSSEQELIDAYGEARDYYEGLFKNDSKGFMRLCFGYPLDHIH